MGNRRSIDWSLRVDLVGLAVWDARDMFNRNLQSFCHIRWWGLSLGPDIHLPLLVNVLRFSIVPPARP